jgi:putative oxidoreductase
MFELESVADERSLGTTVRRLARALPALLVAAFFIVVGYTKFSGDPQGPWFAIFERIGLGQWFRVFTGVVQVVGGALMLWPRSRTYGVVLLASTMIGAAAVDLLVLGSPAVIVPMMLLFVLAAVWATSA